MAGFLRMCQNIVVVFCDFVNFVYDSTILLCVMLVSEKDDIPKKDYLVANQARLLNT